MNMVEVPACGQFTPIRLAEAWGYCQKWNKHVALDAERCLCNFCRHDGGKLTLDPDVYFDGSEVCLHSHDQARLGAMLAEASIEKPHVDLYLPGVSLDHPGSREKKAIKKKKPGQSLLDFK
jgi:hypothetical protein